MKIKSLLLIGSMAVFGMAMSSCSKEENLFDNQAAQADMFAKYSANFVKKYGPVDPNQTWDFAPAAPVYLPVSKGTTRSAADFSITRGDDNIYIENDILQYMHSNMKAGGNNSTNGMPFTFEATGEDFYVVPLYQGVASYFWELWVSIDGVQTKIWQKGQDFYYSTDETPSASSQWTAVGTGKNGVPDAAKSVKAPFTKFTASAGAELYFFLKVWGSTSAHSSNQLGGTMLTSLTPGKMIALSNAPVPAIVSQNDYDAVIVGCEDGADTDFEDLVFMIYGHCPVAKFHKDVEVVEAKRYLIEDLGGADDFDFNDIVVDMQKYRTDRIMFNGTEENPQYVGTSTLPNTEGERAVLRAAGGTHNFTIKVGNTTWSKSQLEGYSFSDMINTGWGGTPIYNDLELAVIELGANDWSPELNNIEVTVEDSKGIKVVTFPETGEVPLMISADPNTMPSWSKERVDIPSWWKIAY